MLFSYEKLKKHLQNIDYQYINVVLN